MRKSWLRNSVGLVFLVSPLMAGAGDQPTGSRITPPTLSSVSPVGVARGTTVEIIVEGLNLAKASAIYFSEPGVTGRIVRVKELPDLPDVRLGSNGTLSTVDVGPLPPRNQVTVEVDVSPDAEIGPVSFRLLTPLGTSPEGKILIEPYYGEAPDKEPNDTPENAFETFLPAILAGAISQPGDIDYFKIQVKVGQELSFLNGAMLIGSVLQPVVTILDSDLNVVATFGENGGSEQVMFARHFDKAGTYYIRVEDYQRSGRAGNFYRIIVGEFPLVLGAYPLGVQSGSTAELAVRGFHTLGKLKVVGKASPDSEDTLTLRPENAFDTVRVALGAEPEVQSQGGVIAVPVTVNGRIDKPGAENRYRFRATKGEQLIFEVNARRLGSDLDSYLEVLDQKGQPIERAIARPVWATSLTLRDHDSAGRGLRISTWDGIKVGDYVMIGGEVIRVEALPLSPDNDTVFEGFGGQRLTFFDTTAEAHAVDSAVYKVQIVAPGTKLSPNGLPVAHLFYRNDDGGPGYGKDSLLHFTAPADGEYIVCIRDVQGLGGEKYAYRLTARHPRPDFRLTVSPRNPNVPAGGTIPVTVTAVRMDGFDGPIDVSLADLPAGLHASSGMIAAGQVSTTIALSADLNAKLDAAAPLRATGKAAIGSATVARLANPEDHLKLISLMPRADILMSAETKEVTLEPGGSAEITVAIQRQGDFRGRVPVEVRNLPPRVRVLDVGLNGVLLNEDESRRSFTIDALPNAEPVDQLIYVSGAIETRSGQQNSYAAPQAIRLHVKVPSARASRE
jgi:uncharacterized cupredoxin-like copper-binding protein